MAACVSSSKPVSSRPWNQLPQSELKRLMVSLLALMHSSRLSLVL